MSIATESRPASPWASQREVCSALKIAHRKLKRIKDDLPIRRLEIPGLPMRFYREDLARLVASHTRNSPE